MRRADIEVPNLPVDGNSRGRSACYPRGSFYPMSDGPSTRNHRITMTDFRLCSNRRSRSQATLYPCAQCAISIRAEVTFARLRYSLGGDRPSQTAHLTVSRLALQLRAVRTPALQGWYPNGDSTTAGAMASTSPTYPVQRVPKSNIRLQ